MPPKRKAVSRTASSQRQQATLSFHGKKDNRVTKASSPRTAKSKKDPALFEDIAQTDVSAEAEPDLDEPTTAEAAIEEQVANEAKSLDTVPDPLANPSAKTEDVLGGRAEESDVGAVGGANGTGWLGDEEHQARKISQAQINKYWRAKETERKAPRVHQQDLSVHEKILREWDMSGQYGVSISEHILWSDVY